MIWRLPRPLPSRETDRRTMAILDARKTNPWQGGASFTVRNRLYRTLWSVTWKLLASWTPPPLHGWRCFLLRLFGARVARTAHVYGGARIWSPANLTIGESAAIGGGAIIYSMAPITLGDYAIVSQGAHLCAGTHDVNDRNFQLRARPIYIGTRAWVAAEAFVGPGVTIGDGAVLGARACAMRDIAPWTICSGNPAVLLRARRRFDLEATPLTEPGEAGAA
jgi:putative colanic acid biosynthesis acetyltransferase WcaF